MELINTNNNNNNNKLFSVMGGDIRKPLFIIMIVFLWTEPPVWYIQPIKKNVDITGYFEMLYQRHISREMAC